MTMLKIDLAINNENRTFIAPFISARMLKNTIKKFGSSTVNTDEGTIDDMANYIVDIFGKQFNYDELLDGISGDQLVPKFTECIQAVTGNLNDKMNEISAENPNV